LQLDVDVNSSDNRGNTVLHAAVLKDFVSVVELLIANGADIIGMPLQRGSTDSQVKLFVGAYQQLTDQSPS